MEGHFCPAVGGATFSVCTRDANTCLFVSAENQACTSPQTCQGAGVVAVGAACGCPANGTTLNTGCASSAINATAASATDNAVLRCEMVGACKIWRILVNCADQSLTAGTDATTNTPACVCKPAGSAPGAANTVYVDPDPPMATFMTNNPTGALQPPACRFRGIGGVGNALAFVTATGNAAFTRVVAIHESSSNVHFPTEPMPLAIPAGIEVTTADGPSFNPAHYTIDLSGGTTTRVTVANGSTLSGFTLQGPVGAMQGPASNGTPLLGCSGGAASAHHLAIVGTGAANSQTGISVTGNCALTSSLVTLTALGTGVNVDYSGAETPPASFTGANITATAIGGTGLLVADLNSRATLTASALTVTGTQGVYVLNGQATLTGTAVVVSGAGGLGLQNFGGQATLNTSTISVTDVTAASRGILLANGTPTLTMTGGSVTLATSASATAVGVDVVNGTATLTGATVTTVGNTHGVRLQNASTVTVNGASVITNTCSLTSPPTGCQATVLAGSNSGSGIVIPTGNTSATLNVAGTAAISKYLHGINIGDGSLAVTGTVSVTGNTQDGIRSWGVTNTTTTTVAVAGATVTGNGNDGVSVNSVVPTSILTSNISTNTGDGIEVQASQDTAQSGYRFVSGTNMIRTNGSRGVFLSAFVNRVGARIENSQITGNVLEGVRASEQVNNGTVITEVLMEGNTISGNLTSAATAPTHIIAGGVFFTNLNPAGTMASNSVRVSLTSFLGNRVFGNGRHEMGFDLHQWPHTSAADAPAWNLSSASASVDQAAVCGDAARPNYFGCYDNPGMAGQDMAVVIPMAAIGPEVGGGTAMVRVKAKGVHFQTLPPLGGRDFSDNIPAPMTVSPEPAEGVFLSCSLSALTCP